MEKVKCTIERITFQNPENGYAVLQATIKGYREEQTLVGTFHEVCSPYGGGQLES